MTKQRLLLAAAPLAMALAGCSGSLGDGVKLESIEVRADAAASIFDSDLTDSTVVIGQCNSTSLQVLTRFSDGDEGLEVGSVRWSTSGPNADKIVIVSNGDPEDSRVSQFPLPVEATTGNQTVTLTANFAGLSTTVDVRILPSMLQIEPDDLTFAVGLDTPLQVRLVQGGLLSSRSAGTVKFDLTNNGSAPDVIFIGSRDDEADSATADLAAGELRATAEGEATLKATLDLFPNTDGFQTVSGVNLADLCQLESEEITVTAKTPTGLEIVPMFVSQNAVNQSSDGNLFLANGTSARVSVNALFDGDQKQDVTGIVRWTRTEADQATFDNDNNAVVPSPPTQAGLVSAGGQGDEFSPGEVIATLILGEEDTDETPVSDENPADEVETLTINVKEYAAADIEFVASVPDGDVIPFGAFTPLQLFAEFKADDGNGNQVTELELDMTDSFVAADTVATDAQGNTDEDTNVNNVSDFLLFNLPAGHVTTVSSIVHNDADNPAVSETATFTFSNDNNNDGVFDPDGSESVDSNTLNFIVGPSDIEALTGDENLIITRAEEFAAPTGTVCIELGDSLDLDALVTFANESDGSTVLPARVTTSTVWSLTGDAATVLNAESLRGRVIATGSAAGNVVVTANYANRLNEDVTGSAYFTDSATLTIQVAAEGGCD